MHNGKTTTYKPTHNSAEGIIICRTERPRAKFSAEAASTSLREGRYSGVYPKSRHQLCTEPYPGEDHTPKRTSYTSTLPDWINNIS